MSLVPLIQTSYKRLLVFHGLVLIYFRYKIAALVTCREYFEQHLVAAGVVVLDMIAEAVGEIVDTDNLDKMLVMLVDNNNVDMDDGHVAVCYFLAFHSLKIPP